MTILALDPGAHTGFAIGCSKELLASGVWSLGTDPAARPGRLAEYVRIVHREYGLATIAYEVAGMGGKNWHAAQRLNELCGAVQAVALELGCAAWAFHISSWKARLGNGRAEKEDVARVLRLLGIDVPAGDQADACGIWFASSLGPPPEPKKKAARRIKRERKREPRLF